MIKINRKVKISGIVGLLVLSSILLANVSFSERDNARTIINLGRDSIKDHTTALLELVKNCYDADRCCECDAKRNKDAVEYEERRNKNKHSDKIGDSCIECAFCWVFSSTMFTILSCC